MTGDVIVGLAIPGVADDATGLLVTHPCSMRSDGVTMVPKLHVALVESCEPIAWASCPRDRMPIPELATDRFDVVRLDLVGMVETDQLDLNARAACLSERGVNLLQQRLVWYFTRFVAPTESLNQIFVPVFEEVDLHEEWVTAAVAGGIEPDAAARDFHDWIRGEDSSGVRRQERLKEAQSRAPVRREMKASLDARYGVKE
jgi:hypothetical protein